MSHKWLCGVVVSKKHTSLEVSSLNPRWCKCFQFFVDLFYLIFRDGPHRDPLLKIIFRGGCIFSFENYGRIPHPLLKIRFYLLLKIFFAVVQQAGGDDGSSPSSPFSPSESWNDGDPFALRFSPFLW